MTARYLLDTSAVARLRKEPVRKRIEPLIERGLLATCALLDLEVGYSARHLDDYDQLMSDRRHLYPWAITPDDAFEQALAVQRLLVQSGVHRGVGIPDLLISVTAAFHELTVLHYDHDFELIADVFAVEVEWVVPPGTAD